MLQHPVDQRLQQGVQQCCVGDHIHRPKGLAHVDRAGTDFPTPLHQHVACHLSEAQGLGRLANAPRGEAGQLLAHHADAAGQFDLVAQGAQSRPVNLAGGGQGVDPLQRSRQGRANFTADLSQQRPVVFFLSHWGPGRDGVVHGRAKAIGGVHGGSVGHHGTGRRGFGVARSCEFVA